MEEKNTPLTNTCSFMGINPIMMALPYPSIQVGPRACHSAPQQCAG